MFPKNPAIFNEMAGQTGSGLPKRRFFSGSARSFEAKSGRPFEHEMSHTEGENWTVEGQELDRPIDINVGGPS